MADLSRITNEVTENPTVAGSTVALLNEISQLIRDAGTDQVALDDLADSLDAQSADLGAAVEANTQP